MTVKPHTDPTYVEFAETIKWARKKAGVSQKELAVKLGLSQSAVTDMETGKRRVDVAEFYKIARAIGESPTRLFHSAVTSVMETENSAEEGRDEAAAMEAEELLAL